MEELPKYRIGAAKLDFGRCCLQNHLRIRPIQALNSAFSIATDKTFCFEWWNEISWGICIKSRCTQQPYLQKLGWLLDCSSVCSQTLHSSQPTRICMSNIDGALKLYPILVEWCSSKFAAMTQQTIIKGVQLIRGACVASMASSATSSEWICRDLWHVVVRSESVNQKGHLRIRAVCSTSLDARQDWVLHWWGICSLDDWQQAHHAQGDENSPHLNFYSWPDHPVTPAQPSKLSFIIPTYTNVLDRISCRLCDSWAALK